MIKRKKINGDWMFGLFGCCKISLFSIKYFANIFSQKICKLFDQVLPLFLATFLCICKWKSFINIRNRIKLVLKTFMCNSYVEKTNRVYRQITLFDWQFIYYRLSTRICNAVIMDFWNTIIALQNSPWIKSICSSFCKSNL